MSTTETSISGARVKELRRITDDYYNSHPIGLPKYWSSERDWLIASEEYISKHAHIVSGYEQAVLRRLLRELLEP